MIWKLRDESNEHTAPNSILDKKDEMKVIFICSKVQTYSLIKKASSKIELHENKCWIGHKITVNYLSNKKKYAHNIQRIPIHV